MITSNARAYIASFLIFFSSFVTHPAEIKQTIDPDTFLRYFLLAEPGSEHSNTNCWRDGLGTDEVAALFCVNKQWNQVCSKLISAPRNAVVEKHTEYFV